MDTGEQTPLTKRISVYVSCLASLSDYPKHHTDVAQIFVNAMMDFVQELGPDPGDYDTGRAIATIDKLFDAAVTASTSVKLPAVQDNVDLVTMSDIKKRKKS